jgi:hypothetical protein
VRVKLRIPDGKQVKAIEVLSPDEAAPQTIQPTASGPSVTFEVRHLATYSVVRVSLK